MKKAFSLGENNKTLVITRDKIDDSNAIECRCVACGNKNIYKDRYALKRKIDKGEIACPFCKRFNGVKVNDVRGDFKVVKFKSIPVDDGTRADYIELACQKCGRERITMTPNDFTSSSSLIDSILRCRRSIGVKEEDIGTRTSSVANGVGAKGVGAKGVEKKAPAKMREVRTEDVVNKALNEDKVKMKVFVDFSIGDIEPIKDSLIGTVSNSLKVLSGVKDDNDRVLCECLLCGSKGLYQRKRVANGTAKCTTHEKSMKLFNENGGIKNLSGNVVNGLKITKQYLSDDGIPFVTLKCLICGNTYERSIISLANVDTVCTSCMNNSTFVDLKCPECGRLIQKERLRDFYLTQRVLSCKYCGEKYNYAVERKLQDRDRSYRNIINRYLDKGLGLQEFDLESGLAIFGIAYAGRNMVDGEPESYHNCYCMTHKQELILPESKLKNYNHKYCKGVYAEYQHMLKEAAFEDKMGASKEESDLLEESLRE